MEGIDMQLVGPQTAAHGQIIKLIGKYSSSCQCSSVRKHLEMGVKLLDLVKLTQSLS